jgi:shikimate dehydrogenase
MNKVCVIGSPVSHSLSPRLHQYWLNQYGIEGRYEAQEVAAHELGDFTGQLRQGGYAGCNVTLPHKEAIMAYLDQIDDTASAIGAVNTVTVTRENKLLGTNTDAYGFIENLRSQASIAIKNKAVILGAGGAARAVVQALITEGYRQIVISNRTRTSAETLNTHFGGQLIVYDWQDRNDALHGADLLVNATSLGLAGGASLDLGLASLPKTAVVSDIVYRPLETPLLLAARAHGNPVVEGLGMLLHQAVPAFAAWFGRRPEVTPELTRHMLEAL